MDLSKLPDSQRQELEQLQKQFQEHQAQQQKQQESAAAVQSQQPPPPYDPFHAHQPYDPSHAYDQPYYYNYHHPSQQQSHQQYDASYYQNYYSNSYHQHHAAAYTAPIEQQRNNESGSGSGSLGLGRFQDPYVNPGNQVNLGGPPGLNPTAAAAAVAALSQLTHFAGAMGAPMAGGGHYDQGHFRPPVGHTRGGRRGGGPFRGGGRGNPGFRPSNTGVSGPPFRGRGRDRNRGRGRGARHCPPSSHPESTANASAQPPVQTARCEVCKVDCTTDEVLGQHNNGKRHKRNLQKLQDRKGAYQPVVQTENDAKPTSDIDPGIDQNIPENEPDKQTEQTEQKEVGDANNKVGTVENDNQAKKHRMKRKLKGRVRGNRGGAKRMRVTGPRHRKAVMPLVCDLCNIKCDTQEVFDRHAAGKKHIAKLKRFEGHQAMYGPTAVQALYPPNPLSQTLGPQPAYYGLPNSYPAPPEAYIRPPLQTQNPNPQLADAPLEFATPNAVLTG